MTKPAGSYDPLVDLPSTPDGLLAFAANIPDLGQRRIVQAMARVLSQTVNAQGTANSAQTTAVNARQMILSRDPRFDTLDERYQALITLTDTMQNQQVELEEQQANLDTLAATYQQQVATSIADRAALRTDLASEATRAKAVEGTLTANLATETTRATNAEQALAARVTKLEALQLRGTTGTATSSSLIAAGSSTLTVPLKTAMPDANYVALALADATAGINLSSVSLAVTARTTTAVTVQIKNSGLGLGQTITVQVLAISLS